MIRYLSACLPLSNTYKHRSNLLTSTKCPSAQQFYQHTRYDMYVPLLRVHQSRLLFVACHAVMHKAYSSLLNQLCYSFMQKLTHKQLQREATQRLNEFMGQIRNQSSVDLSAKNLGEEGCSYVAEALAFNDRCICFAHVISIAMWLMGYICFATQPWVASCYIPSYKGRAGLSTAPPAISHMLWMAMYM